MLMKLQDRAIFGQAGEREAIHSDGTAGQRVDTEGPRRYLCILG